MARGEKCYPRLGQPGFPLCTSDHSDVRTCPSATGLGAGEETCPCFVHVLGFPSSHLVLASPPFFLDSPLKGSFLKGQMVSVLGTTISPGPSTCPDAW